MILLLALLLVQDPVPIVFDTDMDSDCDDAGAIAMLHALADAREVRILATPVSSKHPWSARCVDAFNTFFGRPDVPVGGPKGPGPKLVPSRFAREIAEAYPHDLGAEAPDAVAVYRRVLASEKDGSVVVLTLGDLTNLRDLLESPPDAWSPLDGTALVRLKVRHWVCMGSRYPADLDPAAWGNFKMDPESTVKAVAGWPGRVTFTGGGAFAEQMATGAGLAGLPEGDPVRKAYALYFKGGPRNRHSADQIALLVAARGTGAPWSLVTTGTNHIFPDGRHEWRVEPDHPHHEYISALAPGQDPKAVAGEIERLMMKRRPR